MRTPAEKHFSNVRFVGQRGSHGQDPGELVPVEDVLGAIHETGLSFPVMC